MKFKDRDVDAIDEAFLASLVTDGAAEDKHLDFKEALNVARDSDKKEFLADVTSFANAGGGVLVYGMKEKDKVATELCGVELDQPDATEAQLNNVIISGTDPRVPGFKVRIVLLASSRHAVVVGVPASWMGPHMVAYQSKQNTRFYSRTSNGKYPLDVTELRNAFLLTESRAERIRRFRDDRLAKIVADEGPVPLFGSIKSILNVVPFAASDPTTKLDLADIASGKDTWVNVFTRRSLTVGWNDIRPNFDGYLFNRNSDRSVRTDRYLQVFNNGATEFVLATDADLQKDTSHRRFLPARFLDPQLRSALRGILENLGRIAEPPAFVMLTLCGVKGTRIASDDFLAMIHGEEFAPIDRDILAVPERLIDTFTVDVDEVYRPLSDAIWRAAGWLRSFSYDDKGKWIEH